MIVCSSKDLHFCLWQNKHLLLSTKQCEAEEWLNTVNFNKSFTPSVAVNIMLIKQRQTQQQMLKVEKTGSATCSKNVPKRCHNHGCDFIHGKFHQSSLRTPGLLHKLQGVPLSSACYCREAFKEVVYPVKML